ncbi:MAG: hypothetical protein U5K32_02050 [Bacteroidales bacterium]|nr:hypothetical protein [Bacteroidales bacterium]
MAACGEQVRDIIVCCLSQVKKERKANDDRLMDSRIPRSLPMLVLLLATELPAASAVYTRV